MVRQLRFVQEHHEHTPRVALAVEAAIDRVSGDELGILGQQLTLEQDEPVAS